MIESVTVIRDTVERIRSELNRIDTEAGDIDDEVEDRVQSRLDVIEKERQTDTGTIDPSPDQTAMLRAMSLPELLRFTANYLADDAARWEHPALVTELQDRAGAL